MRAAIYSRISHNPDGTSGGTERQAEDCEKLVRDRGWSLELVLEDDDISAFQKKVRRPGFEALIVAIQQREVDVVVAWKSDRLVRQPRDLERFLDACERSGVPFISCTEPEFSGSSGLLILRMLVAFANHESAVKSERVARKLKADAHAGKVHAGGARCFGFTASGTELIEEEAALLRAAAERIIAGERVTTIAREWQSSGVTGALGGQISHRNLQRILLSPRLCAQRAYKGSIVAVGTWPPIISPEQHARLCAVLGARWTARRQGTRGELTGLLLCGKCGHTMNLGTRNGVPGYGCPPKSIGGCNGTGIQAGPTNEAVARTVLAALEKATLPQPENLDVALVAELRALESRLEELATDYYSDRAITKEEFSAAKVSLDAKAQRLRTKLAKAGAPQIPKGANLASEWEKRGLTWRQAVLSACLESVTVQPVGRGYRGGFESRLSFSWRA